MSTCEAELCPFWSGAGCDCSVFEISDTARRQQQRTLGISPEAEDDFEDEGYEG